MDRWDVALRSFGLSTIHQVKTSVRPSFNGRVHLAHLKPRLGTICRFRWRLPQPEEKVLCVFGTRSTDVCSNVGCGCTGCPFA